MATTDLGRVILMHFNVTVPEDDVRPSKDIVEAVTAAAQGAPRDDYETVQDLDIELVMSDLIEGEEPDQRPCYTVHPFADEWAWDPDDNSKPKVLHTIEDAIYWANRVRYDYEQVPGSNFKGKFWSSIYLSERDPRRVDGEAGDAVGWVDPDGVYHAGDDFPAVNAYDFVTVGYEIEIKVNEDDPALDPEDVQRAIREFCDRNALHVADIRVTR